MKLALLAFAAVLALAAAAPGDRLQIGVKVGKTKRWHRARGARGSPPRRRPLKKATTWVGADDRCRPKPWRGWGERGGRRGHPPTPKR